ncbi:MAG: YmdB family metallophosphoesterase [Anaerolineae bacterium]|nr:YmdB family metallophosphoesterase [Anaerolineae bacterium]
MTRLLFIGDIVGESGLAYLETHLPGLVEQHQPHFVIANAENLDITTGGSGFGDCGMTKESLARLFALPIDLVTGGNHSWDSPDSDMVHADPRVLRPLNYGLALPGRGATILCKHQVRLGVINLTSRTALPDADNPAAALEQQLALWHDQVDLVLVDFHGDSVTEKLAFAYTFAGRVAAIVGTHTHVGTMDEAVLPGGTAYVTDVGMTGPSEGIQGYAPEMFVHNVQHRLPARGFPLTLATGPVVLGAVLITCTDHAATLIQRL